MVMCWVSDFINQYKAYGISENDLKMNETIKLIEMADRSALGKLE